MGPVRYFLCLKLVLVSCLAGLFLASTAQAVGVITVGNLKKVTVHPTAGYAFGYNDNIFLDENNRESDIYHRFSIGAGLLYADTPAPVRDMISTRQWIGSSMQTSDSYLFLDANVDLWRFMDATDANYETYSANLDGLYRSPKGFFIRVLDNFTHTEDPFGATNQAGEGENTKRITNRAALYAGYALGLRTTLQLGYGNYLIDYDEFEDQWQSRTDNVLSASVYYRFLPKTSAVAEYRYTNRYFYEQQDLDDNNRGADDDTSQDSQVHEVLAGLSFDPSAKINGEIKAGIAFIDYDNDENWDGDDYDDITTWSMEGNLIWQAREKTLLRATLLRAVRPSAEDYATHYEDTQVLLGLSQELVKDFALLNAELGLGYADYDVDTGVDSRTDKEIQAGLGMEWLLKRWLNMGLDYQIIRRDSSFDNESYTNNRVELEFRATF